MEVITFAAASALSVGLGMAGTRAILGTLFLLLMRATREPVPPRTVEIVKL